VAIARVPKAQFAGPLAQPPSSKKYLRAIDFYFSTGFLKFSYGFYFFIQTCQNCQTLKIL